MKDGHIHTPYFPHGTNDTFDDYVKKSIEVGLDEISGLSVRGDILFVVSDDMLYISKNGKSFAKTGVDVG